MVPSLDNDSLRLVALPKVDVRTRLELDVLPSALLAMVLTPVITRRELRPLLHFVLRSVELSTFHSSIHGDSVSRFVRSRHLAPSFCY